MPSRRFRSLFLLTAFPCAYSQSNDALPYNYPGIARQFVRQIYPDLTRQLYVTIRDYTSLGGSDNFALFGMELDKPRWMPPGVAPGSPQPVEPNICGEGCICKNPVLRGHFGFDGQGEDPEVVMAWMSGPFLTCRWDAFLKIVRKHHEWTKMQLLNELKSSGAKFGPDQKDAFVRSLPIAKLKPFIGEVEVRSVQFDISDLTWLVRLTWHDHHGHGSERPFLVFEPFEARLIQFSRPIGARIDTK